MPGNQTQRFDAVLEFSEQSVEALGLVTRHRVPRAVGG